MKTVESTYLHYNSNGSYQKIVTSQNEKENGKIAIQASNSMKSFDIPTEKSSESDSFKLKNSVSTIRSKPNSSVIFNEGTTDCYCKSESSGKNYNFCYVDPQNSSSIGKKFDCVYVNTLERLKVLNYPEPFSFVSELIEIEEDVVFVSTTSDDHYYHSSKSYESVRNYYPTHKYILYGLHLSPGYVAQLPNDTNFEFRQFNTSEYPEYVNHWMEYRFKPLIMAEVLKEFPNVWWIDAHIKMKQPNVIERFFEEIATNRSTEDFSSITSFLNTGHSNFATLFPDLLEYFPSNSLPLLKKSAQVAAGIIHIPRTEKTLQIFKWYVLCALDEKCMNPPGAQASTEVSLLIQKEKLLRLEARAPIRHKTSSRGEDNAVSSVLTSTLFDRKQGKLDCNCKSKQSGKSHDFCYVDPQNSTSIGKKFECASLSILEGLELVENNGPFVDVSTLLHYNPEVVFVSAASDNHITQAIESISSFYKHNPDGKYILYSLGLGKYQIKKIKRNFKNLEVRIFNTTGYPGYVKHWMEYRFKVLILAEVMKEFSNIWWLDANIRVEKGNMTQLLFQEIGELVERKGAKDISPIYSFVYTGHSNFPVLFLELLTYFPTHSIPLLKSSKHGSQVGANAFFFMKTEFTIELFKWWVLCALDETCMAPPGAQVNCHFSEDRNNVFAHCFRFDQSVLNLLLLNYYQDHNNYLSKLGFLFSRT